MTGGGPIDRSRISDPHSFVDELIRRDFVSFLMRAFPHVRGGADLVPNWHLDAIAYQLERVRRGDCRRLLVTLPPRSLKSITISVAWVAWCLGQDPSLNFVCVSYSNELSAKHARDCRAIVQSPWYRRLFPRTVITASRSAAYDFETTMGGGRLATSIGGTLTGRGGDIIIIDDPLKPEEAMSETTRNAVNDWFLSTLASRLNDKRRGSILTVMQRLHQYDLAGMLIESGEWDELSIPAIAMEDASIPLTRGRAYRRATGEALHAAREPVEDLLRIKKTIGSINFAAQYQQQPVPAEGNMIRSEWLKSYAEALDRSPGGQVVQSWDTASKEGLFNDWSVCITALVRRRQVFILDVWRRRVAFPELKKAAVSLAREHAARVLLVEDQASGMQLIQSLRNEQPRGVPRPIARKPEADKRTRLAGVSAMIEAGQLLLPPDASWLADFKQELLAFPSCRFDDQVDALSQLLIWVDLQQRMDDTPPAAPMIISIDDPPEAYGWSPWSDPWGLDTDPLY
jgi:predicted phage terminase large subunit-like protein